MTTKQSGGKITGILALTMEAQDAHDVGDAVEVSGDYEVSMATGGKPVLGRVSVSNKKRVNTAMSTTVGVDNVPGDVTVEARGIAVETWVVSADVDAGEEVGTTDGTTVAPVGTGIAKIGLALMSGVAADDDEIDVLVGTV